MDVVEFKGDHILNMDLQNGQAYLSDWLTPAQAHLLERDGWGYTGVVNGIPIASAGVLPMWQGRGMAWAYISNAAAKERFLSVHRAVSRFLDMCYLQRIEMTVDCEFEEGHRWARMLGFNMEAERMVAYRPDGGDCSLYARVRA